MILYCTVQYGTHNTQSFDTVRYSIDVLIDDSLLSFVFYYSSTTLDLHNNYKLYGDTTIRLHIVVVDCSRVRVRFCFEF